MLLRVRSSVLSNCAGEHVVMTGEGHGRGSPRSSVLTDWRVVPLQREVFWDRSPASIASVREGFWVGPQQVLGQDTDVICIACASSQTQGSTLAVGHCDHRLRRAGFALVARRSGRKYLCRQRQSTVAINVCGNAVVCKHGDIQHCCCMQTIG